MRWTIGDTTLTALVEAETAGIPAQLFFPNATIDDIAGVDWLGDIPGAAAADGTIAFRVQAFVIEAGGRTVLVDPCVGNGKQRSMPFWNELHTPWLDRFHAAGFSESAIDMVVHTHLHEDHIGWDTQLADGVWTPTFTNARHIYVDAEHDWASHRSEPGQNPYGDSVAPIFAAGLADVVTADAELLPGLRLQSTPGHTPGHASLIVTTGAENLVVSGDLLHHPLQFANSGIDEVGDVNTAQARVTRAACFDHWAHEGCVVAGTHFPVAPLGRVEATATAWRFHPTAANASRHPLPN